MKNKYLLLSALFSFSCAFALYGGSYTTDSIEAVGAGTFYPNTGDEDYYSGQSVFYWRGDRHSIRAGTVYNTSYFNTPGFYSFGMGYDPLASGSYSFSLGYRPKATGHYSLAFGKYAEASGYNSFSLGFYSKASHSYSTAIGYGVETARDHEFVVGCYNDTEYNWFHYDFDGDGEVDTKAALARFVVGNGYTYVDDDDDEVIVGSDAFVVYDNGSARVFGHMFVDEVLEVFDDTIVQGNLDVNGTISGDFAGSFSGNVGMGTTAPAEKLDVAGDIYVRGSGSTIGGSNLANASIRVGSTLGIDSNELYFKTNAYMGTLGLYDFRLRTGGGDRIMIKAGGNVGIGTTSPEEKLHVNGNVRVGGWLFIDGTDLCLGINDDRDIGEKTSQRALVHAPSDTLIVNYEGDFEGGVQLEGKVRLKEAQGGISMGQFQ